MALIITGAPGSGKSVLRKLCNSHPDIELTEQFRCFLKLDVPYAEHVRALRTSWHRVPVIGSKRRGSRLWRTRNALFVAGYWMVLLARRAGQVGAGDVEAALRHMFPNTPIVGDVHGRYLKRLDTLAVTPGLSLSVVYRDCRDVASCLLTRFHRNPPAVSRLEEYGTARKIAAKWVQAVEAMEQHAGQVHVIRYEDLVSEPQEVLAAFGRWLGVAPEGFQHQRVRSTSMGEYRQCLSDEEIKAIVSFAGPVMERLGYL